MKYRTVLWLMVFGQFLLGCAPTTLQKAHRIGKLLACGYTTLSACVIYSVPIAKTESPDPQYGYLLGRFKTIGNGRYLGVGIKLTCKEPCTEQLVPFSRHNPYDHEIHDVLAIQVLPGTYNISSFVFTEGDSSSNNNRLFREKPIMQEYMIAPFKVEAGKIYYLGDFQAETGFWIEDRIIHNTWKIMDYRYNPQETAKVFANEHQAFKTLEVLEPLRPRPRTASEEMNY
jgi:hypothetical protein